MVFVLHSPGTACVDNDRTPVGAIGNGTELPTNLACTKPEDELEKLPHRSTSSLGVVSDRWFFSIILYVYTNHSVCTHCASLTDLC